MMRTAELSPPKATNGNDKFEEASAAVSEYTLQNSTKSKHHGRANDRQSEKPTCDICGQTFASMQYISMHMKFYTGEKPYECDMGNSRFVLCANSLKTHRRFHTTERPYCCDVCG